MKVLMISVMLLNVFSARCWGGMEAARNALERGDFRVAFQQLEPLARKGDASAQCLLGSLYENGHGVERNCIQARTWYQKSAQAGIAAAQWRLGLLFESTNWWCKDGLLLDDAVAVQWLRKAADQGYVPAKSSLGHHYEYGDGVRVNHAEALRLYREAAQKGSIDDMTRVGMMYQYGKGMPQHYSEALKWYLRSAELGDDFSMHLIGKLYEEGKGVPRDYVLAHMWNNLATVRSNGIWTQERDRLEKQMTPDQIIKAQELARNWQEKHKESFK